jgi:hypothetical protein
MKSLNNELDCIEGYLKMVKWAFAKGQIVPHFKPHEIGNEIEDGFSSLICNLKLSDLERGCLAICLLPSFRPSILDSLRSDFPEIVSLAKFGQNFLNSSVNFLPTVQTVIFLLSGGRPETTMQIWRLVVFQESALFAEGLLESCPVSNHFLPLGNVLLPSEQLLQWAVLGHRKRPQFGGDFPAVPMETRWDWRDLVLPKETLEELREIEAWVRLGQYVLDDLGFNKILDSGLKVLFYGPPGTGKTMAAGLIGKLTGIEVFRIDLSMVISKYIGETEKNLKGLFDQAQSRKWILFFDEADALFGKRTEVSDSKDRYSNQEVSYLLQRLETYDGLVILATNNKDALDKAFLRRFHATIQFKLPGINERLEIWRNCIPKECRLAEDVNLEFLAKNHYCPV